MDEFHEFPERTPDVRLEPTAVLVERLVRAILAQIRPEEAPCVCHSAAGGCCPDRLGLLVAHGAERFGMQAGGNLYSRDIARAIRRADGFRGEVRERTYRPTGLAEGPDGSLYVSDDRGGRIYRISYRGR